MAKLIPRNDHVTELVFETIDAMGDHCSQCDKTAKGNKLLVFATVNGARQRTHNGAFCSKRCHDIFHGLKPASKDKHHD
jgi:hypothetical protein